MHTCVYPWAFLFFSRCFWHADVAYIPKLNTKAEWAVTGWAVLIYKSITFYSPQPGHFKQDVYPGVKYLIPGSHSYVEQKCFLVCGGSQCARQNIDLSREGWTWWSNFTRLLPISFVNACVILAFVVILCTVNINMMRELKNTSEWAALKF